jgi:hypothetical protein
MVGNTKPFSKKYTLQQEIYVLVPAATKHSAIETKLRNNKILYTDRIPELSILS